MRTPACSEPVGAMLHCHSTSRQCFTVLTSIYTVSKTVWFVAPHPPSNLQLMSSTQTINYAREEGIFKSELAGAIVLVAVYVPLFLFNVFRSMRHPTYVLIVLSLFCASTSRHTVSSFGTARCLQPKIPSPNRSVCDACYISG
jgi:hypothetical protein